MNEPTPILNAPPPQGRIDVHCHLLPGVDDGCKTLADSVECITMLKAAGFVGSICTPHIWPDLLPTNTPAHVEAFTSLFESELRNVGVEYHIWPGGELRLFKDVIDWMKAHGVPTMAQSRCVLFDCWEDKWPKWADKALQWLIDQGYRPVMAHPERLALAASQPDLLTDLIRRGVWLQGNFMALTGEDGYMPDKLVRQYLSNGSYQFMALDAHTPVDIESRLDGMRMLGKEFGQNALDHFTINAPRKLIFGSADPDQP